MSPVGVLASLAAGLAALAALGRRRPSVAPPADVTGPLSPKMRLWSKLRALPQLTEDQRLFIVLVAHGETGGTYRPTAHNDTASEVAASRSAWNNNATLAARLTACGHGGVDAWAIGSGGYGGRLVPYFGDDMLDAGLPCDPRGVFDSNLSLVSSIITASKLQALPAWERSRKAVANLRAGYYGLAYIEQPPADRVAKYKRHAADAGIGASFVDRVLPRFPGPAQAKQLLATLQASGIA